MYVVVDEVRPTCVVVDEVRPTCVLWLMRLDMCCG